MISVCHAIGCAIYLSNEDAPRRFCPVHWCTIPAPFRSPLRRPLDEASVTGRLALARAKLAIAELEGRAGVVIWLSGVVSTLERLSQAGLQTPASS